MSKPQAKGYIYNIQGAPLVGVTPRGGELRVPSQRGNSGSQREKTPATNHLVLLNTCFVQVLSPARASEGSGGWSWRLELEAEGTVLDSDGLLKGAGVGYQEQSLEQRLQKGKIHRFVDLHTQHYCSHQIVGKQNPSSLGTVW